MKNTLLITKELVLDFLEKQDYINLRVLFRDSEDADIAEIFSEVALFKSISLFRLLPRSRRVEVFAHLELERQEDFIMELPDLLVSYLINGMEPDDRTRLLEKPS